MVELFCDGGKIEGRLDASFCLKFDQLCFCHCEGGCLDHALLDSDIEMPSLMQHKAKLTVTLLVNDTIPECLEQLLGNSFGNWCQQVVQIALAQLKQLLQKTLSGLMFDAWT